MPKVSGNYNCRQAGVLIVADQLGHSDKAMTDYYLMEHDRLLVLPEEVKADHLQGKRMSEKPSKAFLDYHRLAKDHVMSGDASVKLQSIEYHLEKALSEADIKTPDA